MNSRSYVISVILLIFQVRFSVKWPFSKYFRSNDILVNFVCGQMTFFGKMNFRSNGLRLNGDSVKSTFGQMAFGQTVFGQMVFRSNGLSVENYWWNDFSVKWSRTNRIVHSNSFSTEAMWNAFFEKSFRSNVISVICHFGHLTSFSS
jgi:hypothetical protein